jgi:hypothetical protein
MMRCWSQGKGSGIRELRREEQRERPLMAAGDYFRGGTNLQPTPGEVRIDPGTGLLRTTHGISVYDRPEGLERFGGAYRVTSVPDTLRIVQRGKDPHHHEIVPAQPMSLAEYEAALGEIVLVPA